MIFFTVVGMINTALAVGIVLWVAIAEWRSQRGQAKYAAYAAKYPGGRPRRGIARPARGPAAEGLGPAVPDVKPSDVVPFDLLDESAQRAIKDAAYALRRHGLGR